MSAWMLEKELRRAQKRLRFLAGERESPPSGNGIPAELGRRIDADVDELVRKAARNLATQKVYIDHGGKRLCLLVLDSEQVKR